MIRRFLKIELFPPRRAPDHDTAGTFAQKQARCGEIVAEYSREKDRVTVEDTFARLTKFLGGLDEEDHRAAREGLTESELAIFDLLRKGTLKETELEKLKQASRHLLELLREVVNPLDQWTEKESTRAKIETKVLDEVFHLLPDSPFSGGRRSSLPPVFSKNSSCNLRQANFS